MSKSNTTPIEYKVSFIAVRREKSPSGSYFLLEKT